MCVYLHVCARARARARTHTHTHTVEYYSAIKKENGILPFVTTWMDLEGCMVVKQVKDKYRTLSLICRIRK